MRAALGRVGMVVGGVATALVAAWLSVWVLLVAAISLQSPDPQVPNGDPCCGHPDTWGEVITGGAVTLTAGLLVIGLLVCGAVLALSGALGGRMSRARRRALLRVFGALGLAGAVGTAVLYAVWSLTA